MQGRRRRWPNYFREHWSSYHNRRSALPTFADYAAGMSKARLRKPDGRKSKTAADARHVAHTAGSHRPAPSMKHRLKRSRKAKLLK
jgi:hypothetical protein